MLQEIDMLREKLDEQVINNVSYDEILDTSRKIDELLVRYYKEIEGLKMVV